MTNTYDVIIIGLGGMGSAAAYQLAGRGARVLGLERHTPAHNNGSSHGRSRIIRQAYFEGAAYVPLLLRAYELWEQVERETGRHLLTITGGLMIGASGTNIVAGAAHSARLHQIAHDVFDARDLRRRFPVFNVSDDTTALYESKAGLLDPEACVQAHLDRAAALGAELHFTEPALAWTASPTGAGVRVTTARGVYEAARLIIAPGAWAPQLFADLGLPLAVERQVMYWFDPLGGIAPFAPERCPIYIWEYAPNEEIYGFPAQDGPQGGVKTAFFRIATPTTPETIDRTVHEDEIAQMRACLAEHIPTLAGRLLNAVACMYTLTPDSHFIIGAHPQHPQVVIASPCSGHGFKFASVVGEVLADLALTGATKHDIAMFAPGRFA